MKTTIVPTPIPSRRSREFDRYTKLATEAGDLWRRAANELQVAQPDTPEHQLLTDAIAALDVAQRTLSEAASVNWDFINRAGRFRERGAA